MRNRAISTVILLTAFMILSVSCSNKYTGTFRADESEYMAVLEKNRNSSEQAYVIVDALKRQYGDEWNIIKVTSANMIENGNKSKIKVSDRDLYVDVSDTIEELRKYIGSAASDISDVQKWGRYSEDWNTLESISGYRYYRVK